MAVSVWTDDRSLNCTGWRRGWILPQDLTKTIPQLREEAIMAEAGNDTDLASMKRLAMFAQIPPKQHDQVTPWEEIFLAPHQTGS